MDRHDHLLIYFYIFVLFIESYYNNIANIMTNNNNGNYQHLT